MHHLVKLLIALSLQLFMRPSHQMPEKNPYPNIVLIMTDDQGWGDTGYNGHPYLRTPNIDQMATNGVVFSRFYAASPVCSPTRGSVLTGRHPLRYGICNANCGHLKPQEVTLAELAKERGYTTGIFGKWHLGTLTRDTVDGNRGGRPQYDKHYSPPSVHGFDEYFVTESKVPTWDPMITPHSSAGDVSPSLREGDPFNTFYWSGPSQIETQNIAGDDSRVIMDRFIPFVENTIQKEHPFLGIVWFHSPHLPVIAGERHRAQYSDLSVDQQHYYGALTAMDEQVGRLRKALQRLGVSENTILFFASDNGPEGLSDSGRTQGITKGLRGRKRSLYEGGIRVPGIMEWPETIPSGSVVTSPSFTSDYFPTIASILKIDLQRFHRPYDGINLLDLIDGTREKNLAFKFQEQASLISETYKIYSSDSGKSFALYNLKEDPSESNNIADQYPDILSEMVEEWKDWRESQLASISGADYSH